MLKRLLNKTNRGPGKPRQIQKTSVTGRARNKHFTVAKICYRNFASVPDNNFIKIFKMGKACLLSYTLISSADFKKALLKF